MASIAELDALVREGGKTHVIPPREDAALLQRLRDPAVLERAASLLSSEDREVRVDAVLCLERIGYVLKDQETAELLLRHAERAKDKIEVMLTLDGLSRSTPPRPLPAEPLLRLVRRPQWQVWHGAVQCLHLAPAADVEPALLERITAGRYGRVYVARELRYMTSDASLQVLEQLLGDPVLDVRTVALGSLGERLGAGVLPHARRLAKGRSFQEQWFAEEWIAKFGDAADVPFMATRLSKMTKRKNQVGPPEVATLVPFLLRHKENSRARRALARLHEQREDMPANEREWLQINTPDLIG